MVYQRVEKLRVMFLALALGVLLPACAVESVSRTTTGSATNIDPAAQRAASVAIQQVGIPYRYGGADRNGFDCSGLVYYSYIHAGTHLARTTGGLWDTLRPVGERNLQVGDVLFFNIDGKIAHVGMYLGNRKFVHAPATGRSVSIENLDNDFYRQAFIRAGRAP